MKDIFNANIFGKGRLKSKTPEGQCQPCPQPTNPFYNNTNSTLPQPPLYTCPPHPQIHTIQPNPNQTYHNQQHHQVCPPIQALPMSPCLHQCQSQHPIQSHQHSVTYPIHTEQMRSSMLDSRPTEQAMVLNYNQIQAPIAQTTQQFIPVPAYQNNQIQSVLLNTQTSRYPESSHYSNHGAELALQQQQHQQQQQHHQHQPQQQQMQIQPQIQQQSRQKSVQQSQQHQVQQAPNQQYLVPPELRHDIQKNQLPNQQEYQNHNQIVDELANGHNDRVFSPETLCILHDRGNEELTKLANSLENDLTKLSKELESIRKDGPKYTVREERI